jgi:hypothetical protein
MIQSPSMTLSFIPPGRPAAAWAVLTLFVVPVGGGIAPGVLLAKARQLPWAWVVGLYFASDLFLACAFEPVLHFAARAARRHERAARAAHAVRIVLEQMASIYGKRGGPFTYSILAFGLGPMSARAMSRLAGHGFFSGWALVIFGDMFYFALIASCTLWLRWLLGDGTTAAVVIMAVMFAVPYYLQNRALRARRRA